MCWLWCWKFSTNISWRNPWGVQKQSKNPWTELWLPLWSIFWVQGCEGNIVKTKTPDNSSRPRHATTNNQNKLGKPCKHSWTQVNIQRLKVCNNLQICLFRVGVRQIHGNLSRRESGENSSQRFSHWIGHDLYNYIICRDLAQNTFTHVPCGVSISGREEMQRHLRTCSNDAQAGDMASFYNTPGLSDCVYTFGWAFFCDGYWHMEVSSIIQQIKIIIMYVLVFTS